jgi:hypothetical protein
MPCLWRYLSPFRISWALPVAQDAVVGQKAVRAGSVFGTARTYELSTDDVAASSKLTIFGWANRLNIVISSEWGVFFWTRNTTFPSDNSIVHRQNIGEAVKIA